MSVKIHIGDCRDVMKKMAAGSVHCAITSPPYWGLRDYGTDPTVWGGDEDCEHVWGSELPEHHPGQVPQTNTGQNTMERSSGNAGRNGSGRFCQLCNAWRGNLGLEPTPHLFVDHLVEVMRGVWRVLRDDGCAFVNLGDSYFGDSPTRKKSSEAFSETWDKSQTRSRGGLRRSAASIDGLKPKDLCGIPWRVALALQADGWYLRSAMPWVKASAMPESVKDRVTTAHEYVFMLSKSKRYFYDSESVRQPSSSTSAGNRREFRGGGAYTNGNSFDNSATKENRTPGNDGIQSGRNRRTSDTFNESLDLRIEQQRAYLAHLEHVRDNGGMLLSEDGMPAALMVNTASYKGAHFATFPLKLVQPLIACGTSERGCCPECGASWVRVIERTQRVPWAERKAAGATKGSLERGYNENHGKGTDHTLGCSTKTTGWQPTCTCYDDDYRRDYPQAKSSRKRYQRQVSGDWIRRARKKTGFDSWATVHCTVFDPFGGSGTAALQADRMNRNAVIVELNETYATDLAYERIAGDAPMFADVEIVRCG